MFMLNLTAKKLISIRGANQQNVLADEDRAQRMLIQKPNMNSDLSVLIYLHIRFSSVTVGM